MNSSTEALSTDSAGAWAARSSAVLATAVLVALGVMASRLESPQTRTDAATRLAVDGDPSTWVRTGAGLPSITLRVPAPLDVVAVRVLAGPGYGSAPRTTIVSIRARLATGGMRRVHTTLVEDPERSRWREVAFEAAGMVELTLEPSGTGMPVSVAEIELVRP